MDRSKGHFLGNLSFLAIIFELLPIGAISYDYQCNGDDIPALVYSYFSLTPYENGNVGPFLTAILTCVIFLLALVYLYYRKPFLRWIIAALSAAAVVTSILPIVSLGSYHYSIIGLFVSLLLLGELIFAILIKE